MSKKVSLVFDGPGWGNIRKDKAGTWIMEVIDGRPHQTPIRYGETLEADLEDGSVRSEHLKQQLAAETCRVVKKASPPTAA